MLFLQSIFSVHECVLIRLLLPLQCVNCSSNFIAFVNTHFFSDLRHDIDQPLLLHERDDRSFRVAASGTVKNNKSSCSWRRKKGLGKQLPPLKIISLFKANKTLLNFKFHIVLSPSRIKRRRLPTAATISYFSF